MYVYMLNPFKFGERFLFCGLFLHYGDISDFNSAFFVLLKGIIKQHIIIQVIFRHSLFT